MSALDYIKHAWNLFAYDQNVRMPPTDGVGYASNPIRYRPSFGNERSLINSVVNRIALDAAAIDLNHVRLDDNNRFKEIENSKLNQCLTVEANVDQTGRGLVRDIVMSMLDEGVVAVVPVETDLNPLNTGGYYILSLRTGKITEWKPKHVLVNLYDDRVGLHKDVWLPKEKIAIIENPMFSIMNEHNSTMQRLIRKLSLMDGMDEEIGAGNMNLLVQLPYAVKTDHQRKQAKERIEMLEEQMKGNKLGIGYMDSTEKITQLNRPLENQSRCHAGGGRQRHRLRQLPALPRPGCPVWRRCFRGGLFLLLPAAGAPPLLGRVGYRPQGRRAGRPQPGLRVPAHR